MSLQITPSEVTVQPGHTTTFVASGGVAPYVFSVIPGIGGSIDPDTGIYLAPPSGDGGDTIQVTDANNDTAQAEVIVDAIPVTLIPDRAAIATGLTYQFLAQGGTGPFRYYIDGASDVGFINPSTGVFTAVKTGAVVVHAVDAYQQIGSAQLLVGTPLQLFCDVLQQELGLADGRVYLWDQKIFQPKDDDIYIAVGVLSCKPFANSNKTFENEDGGLSQSQSVNMRATLDVNIISRGPSARDRKEEVIMALNSIYSEQQQELNSFRIFPISQTFVNLSQIDGAAIPYRFVISVNIQYLVTKTKDVPYYDIFGTAGVVTEP